MNNKFLSFLGLVKRSGNLVEGYNKCEEVIKKKNPVYLFIFSKEVSERTKKLFVRYCEEKEIPYIDTFSKEDLGNTLGRPELNVLAVLEKNMAAKLISNYEAQTVKISGGERIVKN